MANAKYPPLSRLVAAGGSMAIDVRLDKYATSRGPKGEKQQATVSRAVARRLSDKGFATIRGGRIFISKKGRARLRGEI